MNILVTGAAGFIGYHLVNALLSNNECKVTGIDNLNNYYDPSLKELRLSNISNHENSSYFNFIKCDISDRKLIKSIFAENNFDIVINLAAQAGVRYSLVNPNAYVDSNLCGFMNILEGCRHTSVKHFIYASSSSVYGMNTKQPFSTSDNVDYPISLYAATKKANELIAHSYSHLYDLPSTGLRFFTVYGPYGRPDMACYKFTESILNEEPIKVYNNGDMYRDFTYIDDIVKGLLAVINKIPGRLKTKFSNASAPYKIYNIGNNSPTSLNKFIESIEQACGKKAIIDMLPMQPGDVPITFADIDDLKNNIGFQPSTSIDEGIMNYVKWHISYKEKKC